MREDGFVARNWGWIIGAMGLAALAYIAIRFGLSVFEQTYWFALLLVPAAWLHEAEEYALADFWGWYNNTCFKSKERFFPLSRRRAFFINSCTVPLVILQAFIAPQFIYITLFLILTVHANAWMHLIYTVGEGKYSPGTITSVLFYWPLTYVAIYQIVTKELVPLRQLVLVFAISVGAGFGLFGYLRGIAKKEPQRLYSVPEAI
ncbi:MAG: HXXEE domain-containing protein [Spirochaetales bacterium]